ncbi:ATP-binding protein [Rufibacter ruber]|uniref:ATP-binding protein n=1 Tax=Rufibacter ruber TaxID=1783499 RepID=UPI000829B6D8|nr:ATP-binding protein [Rufibacter ruber]
MPNVKETFSLHSIRGKIIAAVLLGAVAVLMSWTITQKGFQEILLTVEEVSAPNEKLRTVNSLFQSLTQLDQLQRTHANRSPEKPQEVFRKKVDQIQRTLDSLRDYRTGNPQQLQLLDSLQAKLLERERLYGKYLQLRAEMIQNEALSRRIRSIAKVIATSQPQIDSTVVTASKKITTTTLVPTEEGQTAPKKQKPSFFSRLFGGRKGEGLPPALKQVEEELQVQVDTLSIARQDGALWKVEKMMRKVEQEHHQRTTQLLNREMEWLTANSQLHTQLLGMLRALEEEELAAVRRTNQAAMGVVNQSIARIDNIMIVFSLGAMLLVFLIFLDISRSNRYRKQLIAAKEEAEQLGQVKQRFLANMSHEIRTPLQAILGFSEQIKAQQTPSKLAVEAIHQSSEHLLHIVNEVLDYSRISSGKFSFEQREFNLHQLVTEVIEAMQLPTRKKLLKLALVYELEGRRQLVGDPFRLRQILFNLLGNAIKFTEAGQVTLTVSGTHPGDAAMVCFEVRDTGIGIPAHKLETIFDAFRQADAAVARTHGGTGLGLSIVKALTEGQGGTVQVQSVAGEGTAFRVQLPLVGVPDGAAVAEAAPVQEVKQLAKAGKVLVVDDDLFILQLCGAILQKHHFPHYCTSQSTALLEQDWEADVKLVLLDIRMPHLNGLDLCRSLRARIPADVQIFALTAQALPEERASILAQGFDGLLMKPFREQELVALVSSKILPLSLDFKREAASVGETALHLEALRNMLGPEEALLRAVLQQFVSETEQDVQLLLSALKAQEREPVREQLHRLAGRAGQLGGEELARQLRELEGALQQQEPLPLLQPRIHALVQKVLGLKDAARRQLGATQEAVS